LQAVMDYLRCVLLHYPFADSLAANPQWTTSFDVEAWREDSYAGSPEEYEYAQPRTFATTIEPDKRAMIEIRIATFGEHPSGLGKFTRTMFAQDHRRKIVQAEAKTGVSL